MKIQQHYFPNLIKELKQVEDPGHPSYIDYEIEEILYNMLLKNVCSITSMQDMTDQFNVEECVENVRKLLWKEEREFLRIFGSLATSFNKLKGFRPISQML